MKYRHEIKHEITYGDMLILKSRLGAVLYSDENSKDGRYYIRSLYFDTPEDKALKEKIDGVNKRDKFRIRCYNGDLSFIKLEKKSKLNSLCLKGSEVISKDEVISLLSGDFSFLKNPQKPLFSELYFKMTTEALRPKTLVDYTREAFTYPAGNVRVTLDYDIKTGLSCTDFCDFTCPTVPSLPSPVILEVKYDEFLPDIVKSAVALKGCRSGAFSKYAACRGYY